ncbi:MAG: PorV/PorQ family protein [Fidelibacterota bacterium]
MSLKSFTIFLTFLTAVAGAQNVTKTGTTASKFLSIGAGSRAVAMGGAFVAVADDPTAMYWNVGGLPQIQKPELLVNHTRWVADIGFTFVGVVLPVHRLGTVGIHVTAMTMDEMKETAYGFENGTGATFKAGSYAAGLSYARQLTDRFSIGGTVKVIQEFISQSSAGGLAIDIGTLYVTPFRGLRFGASISNFGQKMQMTGDDLLVQKDIDETQHGNNEGVNAVLSTDRFDLPLLLRVGIARDIISRDALRLTLAMDAMHPNDNVEYVNTGFELSLLNNLVSLRGGRKSFYLDRRVREEETEEQFTVGAGLKTDIQGGVTFGADYAFESFVRLGPIHKFTFRLAF